MTIKYKKNEKAKSLKNYKICKNEKYKLLKNKTSNTVSQFASAT